MNYICKICNRNFKSRMSIMNHIIKTHNYTGQQYYTQTDECNQKIKQTCKEHLGVEYPILLPENREKAIVNSHIEETNIKRKQTYIIKYGVDNPFKLPEVKEKAILNSHTPETISKMHLNRDYRQIAINAAKTKKKNGTYTRID